MGRRVAGADRDDPVRARHRLEVDQDRRAGPVPGRRGAVHGDPARVEQPGDGPGLGAVLALYCDFIVAAFVYNAAGIPVAPEVLG